MRRYTVITIFFICLFVFVLTQIFSIFAPFTKAIFWSAILAFAFFPLYKFFKENLKIHEGITAGLVTLLIFLIVIPPVVILIVNVTGQAIEVYQSATDYIRTGKFEELVNHIRTFSFVQNIEERVGRWDILKESIESWILTSTKSFGNFTASQVGNITKNLFITVLNVLLMVFLVFIFLKDGNRIYNFLYRIIPLEEDTKASILNLINETFAAVIRGQLLTSAVQSTLAGVMFWALGLPVPLLFASATFITAMIPVIGASGVWLPLAIWLFFQQAYIKATILFIFGFLVISLMDNILKPAIIGEKTKLPYFLLFFGILGGIQLYGLVGVFLAPVVLSVFFALVRIYQEEYLENIGKS